MDLAGAIPAKRLATHSIVTVAIDNIIFHKPVFIGDCLECHARVEKIGRTSVTIFVEAYVERRNKNHIREKVTEGKLFMSRWMPIGSLLK